MEDGNSGIVTLTKTMLLATMLALYSTYAMARNTKPTTDSYLTICEARDADPYLAKVDDIVLKTIPGKVELLTVVIPSFIPEWAIGVSTQGNVHYLTTVNFNSSLWSATWVKTGPTTRSKM